MFAGEHFARAAKSSHHFIDNEQYAGAVAPFPNRAQNSWRPNLHPGRALDERFDDDAGEAIVAAHGDDFDLLLQTNLKSPFFLIKALLPHLREGGCSGRVPAARAMP